MLLDLGSAFSFQFPFLLFLAYFSRSCFETCSRRDKVWSIYFPSFGENWKLIKNLSDLFAFPELLIHSHPSKLNCLQPIIINNYIRFDHSFFRVRARKNLSWQIINQSEVRPFFWRIVNLERLILIPIEDTFNVKKYCLIPNNPCRVCSPRVEELD